MNRTKVAKVLNDYRQLLRNCPDSHGYSNDYGCGNCGDLSPAHKTLYNLAQRLALTLPRSQRRAFLKSLGYVPDITLNS